jgi:hypothetical protein
MSMDRREFIVSTAALAVAGSACAPRAVLRSSLPDLRKRYEAPKLAEADLAEVTPRLRGEFDELLVWLETHGWTAFLQRLAGVDLKPSSGQLTQELFKPLNVPRTDGFDDFGGSRAVQPGEPAMSLLYHALASPKVKLTDERGVPAPPERYPSLKQLDVLENYIYALARLTEEDLADPSWVLAVFAYEYRPAVNTPHGAYADLVYSRTGIARVGNREMVYDKEHRCFVTQPRDEKSKQDLAVTPARYGLFLAKPVRRGDVDLIGEEGKDDGRTFLLPFRKVFTGDSYLGDGDVFFSEAHRNEKLLRLTEWKGTRLPTGDVFDRSKPPFVRRSCTSTKPSFDRGGAEHDSEMVSLTPQGSSVLLASAPADLVREACQRTGDKTERLRFLVPPSWHAWYSKDVSNRRYTTLKILERQHANAVDFVLSDFLFAGGRQTTGFRSPRNAPSFVNIRYEVTETDGNNPVYLGSEVKNFEEKIRDGGYWAALFEDSLCDGCVQGGVVIGTRDSGVESADARVARRMAGLKILPAFSLVTAPDLFPLVDGTDFLEFDDDFLEGGTEMLSGGRHLANPNIPLPGTFASAFPMTVKDGVEAWVDDTITAVVSPHTRMAPLTYSTARAYISTNTLPDTASNVFAPGWDATYSNVSPSGGLDAPVYFATYGLGSPFPEDMKLCAAANGMWPGASPDGARTFQGSLDPIGGKTPPTAVPLMDSELGFHSGSPAVRDYRHGETLGWDGEQGPFFDVVGANERWPPFPGSASRIVVNFTDVKRADYVVNALNNTLNMSLLRNLSSSELLQRMEGLRKCLKHLPGTSRVRNTRLWLVSAEKVSSWSAGAHGLGIPANLFGGDRRWATTPRLRHDGGGFFYVFADTSGRTHLSSEGGKRRLQLCDALYVCQVAEHGIAWVKVEGNATHAPDVKAWRVEAE